MISFLLVILSATLPMTIVLGVDFLHQEDFFNILHA